MLIKSAPRKFTHPWSPVLDRVYITPFSITSASLPSKRTWKQQNQNSPITKSCIRTMSSNPTSPPPISHILETCIYARDLAASVSFYKDVFNIRPFMETVRSHSSRPPMAIPNRMYSPGCPGFHWDRRLCFSFKSEVRMRMSIYKTARSLGMVPPRQSDLVS